jgi:fibronectin type 3 domain-containing protein
MTTRPIHIPRFPALVAVLTLALGGLAACDDDPTRVTRDDFEPELEEPVAIWIQDRWQGRDPLGQAAVQLRWGLPDEWDGEVFRVYSRESGGGEYFLIATVTSCANRECVYTDTNVVPGESYDYFVAAVDERSDDEIGESEPWQITVPAVDEPDMPTGLAAIALDNGIFLTWTSVGAEKYRVFLEGVDTDSVFFEIGATDATGYVDGRAENGIRYAYRVAAVGADGHVSRRSDSADPELVRLRSAPPERADFCPWTPVRRAGASL